MNVHEYRIKHEVLYRGKAYPESIKEIFDRNINKKAVVFGGNGVPIYIRRDEIIITNYNGEFGVGVALYMCDYRLKDNREFKANGRVFYLIEEGALSDAQKAKRQYTQPRQA